MAESVVNAPAGSPAGGGQAGGQGGDGGGNLLPGQGPGGGQPSGQPAGQGQPTGEFVPKTQYDELRTLSDRRHNELTAQLKQLQTQFTTRQPAPTNGGRPQPNADGGTLGKLSAALGLDDSGAKLLESFLEEKYGPVNERAQWLQDQVERQEFFSQYPSFRQHEAKILDIDKKLESGEMSVMHLKAMAFLGMNAQDIVNNAVANAKKEWEKTEREKIRASGGGGSGARPGATVEERVGATKAVFGVDRPSFTNKPTDD